MLRSQEVGRMIKFGYAPRPLVCILEWRQWRGQVSTRVLTRRVCLSRPESILVRLSFSLRAAWLRRRGLAGVPMGAGRRLGSDWPDCCRMR